MQSTTKYVTKEILTYYDGKIKEYVDDKVNTAKEPIDSFERRIDAVEVLSSVNEANIKSNKDHIDENEAAILVLQEDDKKIVTGIAAIQASLESTKTQVTDIVAELERIDTEITSDHILIENLIETKADKKDHYTKTEIDLQNSNIDTQLSGLSEQVADKASKAHDHSLEDVQGLVLALEEKLSTNQYELDKATFVKTETFNTKLQEKSDSILFTKDAYVGVSEGEFVTGDSLTNLTIKEILTKLLKITDKKIVPSNPTASDIIKEEKSPYTIDSNGELVTTDFNQVNITLRDSSDDSSGTFFYNIVDTDNTVVESGYQIDTIEQNRYLTIGIPKEVTKFSVKQFNGLAHTWETVSWSLAPVSDQTIEGYTIYSVPEEYAVLSGITIRVVIE